MRTTLSTSIAVAAATVGLLVSLSVSAHAAESAAATIGQLEAQGLDVRIDRIGTAPLDQCVVTSIRNPQDRTKLVRVDGPGSRDRFVEVVVARTVTVSLDCSRR